MSEGARIDGASLLLGAALGSGVGAVLGWLLTRRTLEKEIASEVAGVKRYYADKASATAAAGEDRDAGERTEATVDDPEGVRTSGLVIRKIDNPRIELVLHPQHPALEGFEDVGDGGDEEDEDADADDSPPEPVVRDTTRPYVISDAEFFEENEEYNKITVTYYQQDDVLCDERDAPIRDTSIVGVGFAELFGQDSNDPHIVHIRNDKLQVDFEIVRNEGSYTEIVLGYGKPP